MVEDILEIWRVAHTPCATHIEQGWEDVRRALGNLLNAPTGFVMLSAPNRGSRASLRPLLRIGHSPSSGQGSDRETWHSHQRPPDGLAAAMARSSGRVRAVRRSSLPEHGGRSGRPTRAHRRNRDRLMGGLPLAPTVELYVALDRGPTQGCFTDRDAQVLEKVLPALERMGRWLALSKGILPRGHLLTEDEQRVLVELLRGFKQHDGAERLAMNPTAFRHRSKSLYKKLGVAGRNELAALWLQTASSGTPLADRRRRTG